LTGQPRLQAQSDGWIREGEPDMAIMRSGGRAGAAPTGGRHCLPGNPPHGLTDVGDRIGIIDHGRVVALDTHRKAA